MNTQTPMINPARIASLMSATRSDPRADVCSQAFFFLSVFRDTGIALPTIDETCRIISALQDHAAVVLSTLDVAQVRGHRSLDTTPNDGAFVVFEDFSALWFDGRDRLGETEITMDTPEGVIFGMGFPFGLSVETLGASANFTSRFGALEDHLNGNDQDAISYLDNLFGAIFDQVDPPFDGIDAIEQNWSPAEVEELNDLITTIWLGIGADFEAEVNVMSASGEFGYDIAISAGEKDANGHKDRMTGRFIACLEALEDLSRFQGWEWLPNDSAFDRRSGYDKTPITVMWQAFDPANPEISNHRRIAAPQTLRALLALKDVRVDDIESLTAHARVT